MNRQSSVPQWMWPALHTQQKYHISAAQEAFRSTSNLHLSASQSKIVGGFMKWRNPKPSMNRILNSQSSISGSPIYIHLWKPPFSSFPRAEFHPFHTSIHHLVQWSIRVKRFGYGVGQIDLFKRPRKQWQHEKLLILMPFYILHSVYIVDSYDYSTRPYS